MILDNTILNDNGRNIKIIESFCIKKNEIQPNGIRAKSQVWWYKVQCLDCGYEYYSPRGKIISRKDKCALCSGRVVVRGVNDLYTTSPHIIKYLYDKNDGYKYSKGSNKKVMCVCPFCGYKKEVNICNLINHSFYCDICSDNISYPNKVFINILQQLNVNFIAEYSPEWIGKKRYDFYLKDYNAIIEADGKQHIEECKFMIPFEEQNKIDKYKDLMAFENNIKMIRIDCSKSEINFIKDNILKSELSKLLDFSNIDWTEVEKFTTSNLLLKACQLKKENDLYTTSEIGKILSISQGTISRWLKIGNDLGLCKYNSKEEMSRNGKRQYHGDKEILVYDINNNFLFECSSIKELAETSKEKLGKYISRASISKCCNNHISQCKGFIIKFK